MGAHSYRNIIISGPPASGKSTLADALAEDNRMRRFSVGDMLRMEHAAECPENMPSFDVWWRGKDLEYSRKVALGTIPVFNEGWIVGDSRYVSFLDRDTNLLVFLNAGIDVRASRAVGSPHYKDKSVQEIREILRKREEDEVEVGMKLFGKDYRDPGIYHLVLNSESLTVMQETDAINGLFHSLGG